MLVKLYHKNIIRYNTPENRDTHNTIKSIEKEFIHQFNTNHIPCIDEIIYLEELNAKYQVINRIRILNSFDDAYFVLEVIPYNDSRLYISGSDTWREKIPLVCDIPDATSN